MRLNSKALTLATILVIWLVVLMALFTELSAPFKTFLTQLAGHHWIAKSIISSVAFVLFYFLFRKMNESDDVVRDVWYVVGSVVLGGLIIFSFYLWLFIQG